MLGRGWLIRLYYLTIYLQELDSITNGDDFGTQAVFLCSDSAELRLFYSDLGEGIILIHTEQQPGSTPLYRHFQENRERELYVLVHVSRF